MINIRKGQFSMKQVLLVDPGRESSRQHRLGDLSGNTEKIRFCDYLYYSKRPGAGHIKGKLCGISPGGCELGNRQINIKKRNGLWRKSNV